jgi:hypothetical protein
MVNKRDGVSRSETVWSEMIMTSQRTTHLDPFHSKTIADFFQVKQDHHQILSKLSNTLSFSAATDKSQ